MLAKSGLKFFLIRNHVRDVIILVAVVITFIAGTDALASSGGGNELLKQYPPATTFLWIAVILLLAKISRLIVRLGQPAVLGELIIGVIIGNLAWLGIHIFEPLGNNPFIAFLAELGVVILLFQVGLESNIQQMRKVGLRAFLVATVGVVVPFVLGAYIVGPWLLPGLTSTAYLFLGATLTATSVGITARVFKDLGKLQTPEAQIVLGAAVIDDVIGLIILAVVSAIATTGAVSIGAISIITAKAVLFLVGAIVLGQIAAPQLGKAFSIIHTGIGMKFTLAISFGLIFAYLSQTIGLAPIVGAFAAGLVLDAVHFRYFKNPPIVADIQQAVSESKNPNLKQKVHEILEAHAHQHVERLVTSVGHFFVPIFFVMVGFSVKLQTLIDPSILLVAMAITVAAVLGKICAGAVAGNVNKLIVGVGMIPRGEVGLIFMIIGKSLGVISEQVFSVMIVVIILTTLLTPPLLSALLQRPQRV